MNTVLSQVKRTNVTNNTQRVGLTLLRANGGWISRNQLSRSVSSAAARVRDLRKAKFGGFKVECKSATELNKRGDRNTFFYRIVPRSVTTSRVRSLFRL